MTSTTASQNSKQLQRNPLHLDFRCSDAVLECAMWPIPVQQRRRVTHGATDASLPLLSLTRESSPVGQRALPGGLPGFLNYCFYTGGLRVT